MSDDMMAQLIAQLSPIEQAWFAQCRRTQDMLFALMQCPRWRFFRRADMNRQLAHEVALCEQMYRVVVVAANSAPLMPAGSAP